MGAYNVTKSCQIFRIDRKRAVLPLANLVKKCTKMLVDNVLQVRRVKGFASFANLFLYAVVPFCQSCTATGRIFKGFCQNLHAGNCHGKTQLFKPGKLLIFLPFASFAKSLYINIYMNPPLWGGFIYLYIREVAPEPFTCKR